MKKQAKQKATRSTTRAQLVVITDASGEVERHRARNRHAAFTLVRNLAIRRVTLGTLTDCQREAAFWKLHRITIRALGVR